ncbi:glycosyltransferase [Caproiciproducens sp. MSJ-32]|uniref:glycosyltransferase n=1 Tax=Caproiciproducens sp. MSJ-32 TaxID=2841527 RepID=UPI001C115F4E|nr:glycosyltransferase [Caproiciproducens sp. MSJ-32]
MINKKISVIMSVYNEKEIWLKEAIDSILNQTFHNFEFIIIMDKPDNQNLIKLLRGYEKIDERIRVYVNEKNMGLVRSLNKALKLCSGEFIARMDADDYSYPERFKKQIDFFSKNQNIDLCATGVVIMDENGNEMYKAKIYGTTPKRAEKSLIYRNVFPHGSWMIRKSKIDELGGYLEINQAEDYDLLFRMLDRGMKISVIPEYLFKYRLRNTGISYKNLYKQKKVMLNISEQYVKATKENKEYVYREDKDETEENAYEIEKYSYYQELYTSSITDIRNKHFGRGAIGIIRTFCFSSYKRKEIKSTIALKIINKIYK